MKNFSALINKLESTNKTSTKVEAIVSYLQTANENDKLWLLRLFSGNRPKRPVNTTFLRQWALELSHIPEWLFIESYSSVGDLGETIALILPPPTHTISKTLSQWMDDLAMLHTMTDEQKKEFVIHSWNGLDYTERFIFNKLIGGSFRIGVSQKILITAIAKYSGREEPALMHSIMGTKNWTSITFEALIAGDTINEDNSKPYPFCLAYPLEKEIEELGAIDQWQIEYKWDGIRGQLIKRNGEVFIWSRGEELVTDSFPELKEALSSVDGDFVIDGEILVVKDNLVLNFNELQKRLNRKTISKKMMEDLPVKVFLYDMIERNGQDVRQEPLHLRREWLQNLIQNNAHPSLHISPIIQANSWEEVAQLRADSRHNNSEGLMLKMRDSVYHSGRKKGDWWKWKVNPLTIDAVLIYAQKGSGRRSAYYTDYTFAVRQGDELVTIAKAYSGLTDKEIIEVSKFVNKNAIEKFGPVRTVKPELVFEIAFEGINFSNRHKSGVALRFPRILRWRQDKTVADIDDIESVKALIQ